MIALYTRFNVRFLVLLLTIPTMFTNHANAGLFDSFTSIVLPLRGAWDKEPNALVHRGITAGESWAIKPCHELADKIREACLGKVVFNGYYAYSLLVHDLPPIGVTELKPVEVRFDNSGRVLSVRVLFDFNDYEKIKIALVEKYGTPSISSPNTVLDDLDPEIFEKSKDWGMGARKYETESKVECDLWTGKKFAIVLDRFHWDAQGNKGKGKKRNLDIPVNRPTASLMMVWLPSYDEFVRQRSEDGETKIKKKYQQWRQTQDALKSNL